MARLIQLFGSIAIWMDQQLLLQFCQQLCTWPLLWTVQFLFPSALSAQDINCVVLCDACKVEISGFHRRHSYLRSSEMLHSIYWQLVTDVSGRHIGPILKCQAVQDHRLKPTLRDVLLPVAKTVAWVVLECMWSIGGMTLTGDNTSTRRDTRSSANLSTINPIRPGTSSFVRAVRPVMIRPTRRLVEGRKASRAIRHVNKTIIIRHLPQSETVPKHAQYCSLLKICNPKCCKLFRSYLHILWPPLWSRVSGYRYRGLGFDSRRYQIFWVVVGLERGPLNLMRSIEELLE